MRSTTAPALLLAGAGLVAALSGCTSTTPGSAPTATVTTTATPPPPTEGTATSTCGPSDARDAAAAPIAALPVPEGLSGETWDASGADYSGYDACAALSWSVATFARATSSSPYAILLFHDGSYLGTATSTSYAFSPNVAREADDRLSVTYRYAKGSDSNADPTGRTTATLTWNASTQKVDFSGTTPPTP
ncbi:LppP/LprE lipoprotein [Frondihabitans sp. PhB188]|uniref:LppP/LprE family lipoprotein n=1 Tax=Frondihabitans sp. PhB188 TaxID=2485200 RepID=UPI000F49AD3A|nr:LppP/LprE family lipoprotein [Frondihabitans sp. PhB188]ROQ38703.1 LppP/LprE lipoprotein [Frondihabitans sp. PhB188]